MLSSLQYQVALVETCHQQAQHNGGLLQLPIIIKPNFSHRSYNVNMHFENHSVICTVDVQNQRYAT